MKIPFDIKYRPQIESGEYKIVTRNGNPARILCWDLKGPYPIAYVVTEDGEEIVFSNTEKCKFLESGTYPYDLFIITPDPESEDERIRKEILLDIPKVFPHDKAFRYIAYLEKQKEQLKEPEDKGEISDGYHTFNELYYYRMLYNAAFFNLLPKELVHKSKRHHDGEECFGGGWFIVMANLPTGQISNHYELKDWDLFQIPEKEIADEWDGHTPQGAAERLHKYFQEKQEEQKPVEWSEEDKRILNELLDHCNTENATWYNFLKSLPERFNLQPKQEWSEEEYGRLFDIEHYLDGTLQLSPEKKIACIDWLKSLRPVKQEWSEDDEKRLELAIHSCEMCGNPITASWLKSLRPQPRQEQTLTWEDMEKIVGITDYLTQTTDLPLRGHEALYTEVLRQFKEYKK